MNTKALVKRTKKELISEIRKLRRRIKLDRELIDNLEIDYKSLREDYEAECEFNRPNIGGTYRG